MIASVEWWHVLLGGGVLWAAVLLLVLGACWSAACGDRQQRRERESVVVDWLGDRRPDVGDRVFVQTGVVSGSDPVPSRVLVVREVREDGRVVLSERSVGR